MEHVYHAAGWTSLLYVRTVYAMSGDNVNERQALEATAAQRAAVDPSWRCDWHSAFGLIVIEVRGGSVYVNGDKVEPAAVEVRGALSV